MNDLDTPGLQEFGDWYEVLVGRDEHGNIIVIDPSEADHVRCHADIDALLLCPPHVSAAGSALGYLLVTRWATGR